MPLNSAEFKVAEQPMGRRHASCMEDQGLEKYTAQACVGSPATTVNRQRKLMDKGRRKNSTPIQSVPSE